MRITNWVKDEVLWLAGQRYKMLVRSETRGFRGLLGMSYVQHVNFPWNVNIFVRICYKKSWYVFSIVQFNKLVYVYIPSVAIYFCWINFQSTYWSLQVHMFCTNKNTNSKGSNLDIFVLMLYLNNICCWIWRNGEWNGRCLSWGMYRCNLI
jgi:hypothetical protein